MTECWLAVTFGISIYGVSYLQKYLNNTCTVVYIHIYLMQEACKSITLFQMLVLYNASILNTK